MTTRTSTASCAATAALAAICALTVPTASFADIRTWNQNTTGTYEWNAANFGGTLPTADDDANFGGLQPTTYRPNGNQTITGDGEARSLDFHNGEYYRLRTFTGDIVASNLVLRTGRMRVEGSLELTGTDQSYSIIGAAMGNSDCLFGILDIRSGGSVRAAGVHALCVGRRFDSGNTAAGGRVILRDGGSLVLNPSGSTASYSGLLLGRSTDGGVHTKVFPASYVQEGGTAVLGRVLAGFEAGAYGSVTMLGGTLDMPYISGTTRFRIGNKGYGMFQQFGGDVYCETNRTVSLNEGNRYATRQDIFELGSGRSSGNGLKGAYYYANGGTFTTGADFAISGAAASDVDDCAPIHATIDGDATMTARTMRIGANDGSSQATLNLNGGTLKSDFIFANPARTGRSEINADGGKIVFGTSAVKEQFLFLDAINIYEGGLEINVAFPGGVFVGNAGTNVLLRTPGGYGVDIASVSDVASSVCPPWIEISGGSGSNACAVAFASYSASDNSSGVMTNAAVVCRGEGYQAGETVTATVYRPWGATQRISDRVTLRLVENKPGALVKTGGYNLSLFAQPEFEGTYEVRQGFMVQSTVAGVCSPKVRAVIVGGTDNAAFQAGSGDNGTAREATWNPINPAATLTLGTAYGPGMLRIPGGADDKPFRQTFASLSVFGTGNAIERADVASGTRLSFGTISCADGSSLTVPSADSTFKVYVTGANPGTTYPNIHFADKAADVGATVAADGQLVPAAAPFVLTVR